MKTLSHGIGTSNKKPSPRKMNLPVKKAPMARKASDTVKKAPGVTRMAVTRATKAVAYETKAGRNTNG